MQDGPPADEGSDSGREENEAKCVIMYKNKVFKWYLDTDDGTIDHNEEAFQDFCDFLEDAVGLPCIDIDDMDDEVEIFLIDNKDEIDDDSQQIECADDFGDVFENFDPDNDPCDVFYFVVKVKLSVHGWFVLFFFSPFHCFFFDFIFVFKLVLLYCCCFC